ncbi:MAG: AAA family ATPase [Caldilinea sp. CFX5]|nr:AAA family ATPase [Caldilinea sp. CFX5]
MPKPLPIGEQTFRKLIENGYLYVDKTPLIYEMIRYPSGVYFLSRPRRFGKSLLISTLEEIFLGNKELFQGLWLYTSDYQWESHPVIRFDFSLEKARSADEMREIISTYLKEIAAKYGVKLVKGSYQRKFRGLIEQLGQERKVVVLIDEYDYPIIDNMGDTKVAIEIREVLKGFYTVMKGMDRYLRFIFLTGVSKFSRVGIFSGLNNLKDITIDDRFASLPGITQAELEAYFPEYINRFAQRKGVTQQDLLHDIKVWYNGFRFSKEGEAVYNPFSLLLLLDMQDFRNYWFESGTPTFLIKLIKERNFDLRQLNQLQVSELAFSSYEIDQLQLLPLLFQTGYLTIKGYDPARRLYDLYYPNYEVEDAFSTWLLGAFSYADHTLHESHLWRLIDALRANDLATFFKVLQIFFAQIPYNIQIKDEHYYQSIFYLIFTLLGLRLEAEKYTNRGRIDTVIELPGDVYIFEFKLDGTEDQALEQIKTMGYADPYRHQGKTLHLVGVNFSLQQRSITGWKVERIKPS